MEIKQIKPQKVYFKSFETTLKNLGVYVQNTPTEMYENLEKYGIQPTGHQIWSYYGGDGNPDTKFTLEIAIPVSKLVSIEGMDFKELPEFKCASLIHKGPWHNLKNSYGALISEIYKSENSLASVCREVYIKCDFDNPENNITEIQVGIN